MQIESLELQNYRLFRQAVFEDLSPMTVVVGANGSGKSTLFDVFAFLKESLTLGISEAVAIRGGFEQLVSRGEDGPIGITLRLWGEDDRRITYQLEITEKEGAPRVRRETLIRQEDASSSPALLLSFSEGRGSAVADGLASAPETGGGREKRDVRLGDPSGLALKAFGEFEDHQTARELRAQIESWHLSDLHMDDARPSNGGAHAEHLNARGDNVAQVARFLHERHPQIFAKILEVMAQRIPGVRGVEARTTEDGRLVLRFEDANFQDPFLARHVSDGTLKMFAFLVLLYDPRPHPLLAVEEPENQLYPELLHELVEEFRDYTRRGGQVFVSTHSPDFLNGVRLDEIYWLVKEDGFSTIRRARDNQLLRNLIDEGDLPGALWKQGLFPGAGLR